MTKCKACGAEFRKGTLAFLLTKDGLKGARVCQKCAASGVTLVAVQLPPVHDTVKADKRVLKEHLAPFVKNLTAQLIALKAVEPGPDEDAETFALGKREALENVIALLKDGRA